MTTETETREALLRPYAEAPCPCLATPGGLCGVCGGLTNPHDPDCERCTNHSALDKRFDVLRGEHDYWVDGTQAPGWRCRWCAQFKYDAAPYCPRTDLGSIVRVAAACGLSLDIGYGDGQWGAIMGPFNVPQGRGIAEADTPEDAAAQAFVAAVPLA